MRCLCRIVGFCQITPQETGRTVRGSSEFPTAIVRPLSSLAKFSFVISNMLFLPKNVVHHFPASTLAIASTVLRSRAGRRPTTAGFMPFVEASFGMTGAVFFVFSMVVFGLRTTLLAINREFPVGTVGGALTNRSRATVPWLNFVAVLRWDAPALHTLPRRLPGLRGRPGRDPRS